LFSSLDSFSLFFSFFLFFFYTKNKTDYHGGKLRRSSLPEHSSLDGKKRLPGQKSVALSEYIGMRALKTEFMQYIVTTRSGSMLERYFERRAGGDDGGS